jgi:hypothetical protein
MVSHTEAKIIPFNSFENRFSIFRVPFEQRGVINYFPNIIRRRVYLGDDYLSRFNAASLSDELKENSFSLTMDLFLLLISSVWLSICLLINVR